MKQQVFPNLGQAFGIFGLTLLFSLLLSIPLYIIQGFFTEKSIGLEAFFGFLNYTIPFSLIAIYFIKKAQKSDKSFSLNFNKVNPLHLLMLIPATLALVVVIEPLTSIIPMPDFFKNLMEEMFKKHFISLITIAVSAPILEEILFRGVILRGLLKHYSPAKAIFWSAFIFGLVHLNPWQFIAALLGGSFMGFMYWKTNSIIPGIIIHFVNNFTAGVMTIYFDVQDFQSIFKDEPMNYNILYGVSLIILIASVGYFSKTYRTKGILEAPKLDTEIKENNSEFQN